MDMLRQQYEQASRRSDCVTGGCTRRNSCNMARCIQQYEAMMAQLDLGTRCQNAEKETGILKCNRRCQQGSCQVLSNCLKKLEGGVSTRRLNIN